MFSAGVQRLFAGGYNRAMLPSRPPLVLLLPQQEADRQRWAEMLRSISAEVVSATSKDRYEVLISDRADAALALDHWVGDAAERANESPPPVSLLGIGEAAAGWADIILPLDFTTRELCLACTLLAEVSRLRRQRDAMAHNERQAIELAETDPLTELPNRRAWERNLIAYWDRAQKARESVCLAILDLDGFKIVNDQGGLAAGDRVLRAAGAALAGALRRGDMIARIGGDEFGVLLSGVATGNARAILERLLTAVIAQKLPAGTSPLTVSIGYAVSQDCAAPNELFAAAERALREAKRAGGNRVHP